MPLYEYQCESCANRFERIQKFSDPLVDTCPACGGTVKKLLSSPAIQFKGSGWYITDYARKSKSDDSSSNSKAQSGDSSPESAPASGGDKASSTPAAPANPAKSDKS
jgi:putative FmdB family regulatory protein